MGGSQELTCTYKPSTKEARESSFLWGKSSGLVGTAPAQRRVSGWAVLSFSAALTAPSLVGTGGGGHVPQLISTPWALGHLQHWGSF